MRLSLLFASVLILLAACTQNLPLPQLDAEKKIVLLGEMVAEDTLTLQGSISLPVKQGASLQPELPADMRLRITCPTEPTLALSAGEPVPYQKTLSFSAPQPVGAGATYTVVASVPGLPDATAVAEIPKIFLAAIVDTATVRYAGARALRVTVRIFDRGAEKNYYAFEAVRQLMDITGRFEWEGQNYKLPDDQEYLYILRKDGKNPYVIYDTSYYSGYYERLATYTDDPATENVKISSAVSPVRRVLLTDQGFEGGTYDLNVYVDKANFTSNGNLALGRVVFTIKSLSPDYYRYLRAYESFASSTTIGTLAQPVRIDGNVTNGFGVVGGVYRIPFYYVFDRAPY